MRLLPLLFLSLSLGVAARADEITLRSGKVIAGKITSETDQSYTIRLGSNMYLSVAKEDVSTATRDKPPAAPRSTLTLEQATASTSTVVASTPTAKPSPSAAARPASPPVKRTSAPKPAAPKSPAPASSPVTGAPAPKKLPAKAAIASPAVKFDREVVSTETLKIGVARIERTTRFRTYDVDGRDFESARRSILEVTSGKGFLEGQKRSPSKTAWDASWSGTPGAGGKQWKEVVVTATATVQVPGWTGLARASDADAEKWGAFLKEATDHELGHLGIIHDALMSFSESASNLTNPGEKELRSETQALFKAIQDQAAKRRQGYERRESRPALPIKKKK